MAVPVAVALVAPWLLHVVSSFRFQAVSGSPTASSLPPPFYYSYARISYIESVPTTPWLLLLIAAGTLIAILQRRTETIFLVVWGGLLLAFSNPYFLPLPWSGLVDFVTVVSIIFIPAAIIAGYALTVPLNSKWTWIQVPRSPFAVHGQAVYGVAVLLVAVLAATQTIDILRPRFSFLSEADLRAFEWIKSETPSDATFLTRIRVSQVDLVEPVDGGVWITYFTGRRQTAPPLIYAVEREHEGNYEATLRRLAALQDRIGKRENLEELSSLGITHIYSGDRRLSLSSRKLKAIPWLRAVYEDGGVQIFELAS